MKSCIKLNLLACLICGGFVGHFLVLGSWAYVAPMTMLNLILIFNNGIIEKGV